MNKYPYDAEAAKLLEQVLILAQQRYGIKTGYDFMMFINNHLNQE